MKNALNVQRYGKMHLLGWSNVEQWKNQARSLSHCWITRVQADRQFKTHGSESWGQKKAKQSPKTKRATNYCVCFTQANVFVIWRHNHSQSLEPRQLLNLDCRLKTFLPTITDKSNRLSSLSFPAWSKSMNFVFTSFFLIFFFFDGNSQFSFLHFFKTCTVGFINVVWADELSLKVIDCESCY